MRSGSLNGVAGVINRRPIRLGAKGFMDSERSAPHSVQLSAHDGDVQLERGERNFLSRTPDLHNTNVHDLREMLLDYFATTFDRYESLFEHLVCDEGFYEKSIPLRHPLIFYYGHTAVFFVNKLLLAKLINQRINPRFESMFSVGVDEMSWDDLDDVRYDWPPLADVKAYRDQVRQLVMDLIANAPLQSPIDWRHPWWAIVMGIEHERIHLETSSVLITQQKLTYVSPHPLWPPCTEAGDAPENSFAMIAAGTVRIGRERFDAHYGWDNEYGMREAAVAAFHASRYLVSNQEFLAFVEDGGYSNADYWQPEGKAWLAHAQARHPTFWREHSDGWYLRLMAEEIPMPWNWPVSVNYHEAKVFCDWKAIRENRSVRLPTEDEWYLLHGAASVKNPGEQKVAANLHLDNYASACPIDKFRHGDFHDVVGNVWQWTETPIYPLDGFDVHPIYDDFTVPTFDGRHNLIKGGSWISCGNEAQYEARYAFRRHFFQHAGFRYVASGEFKPVPVSQYETDKLMSEYAEFHYGDEYFGVANFSQSLVALAKDVLKEDFRGRALDLGCASGCATFELARYFDAVTGVDFSARFIRQGALLAQSEPLRYALIDEGELMQYKSVSLADLGLQESGTRVEFFQGDACNLGQQFKNYDFILAANLIDRLYSPGKFLDEVHHRLNPGGVLMIASPYTWLGEQTPREEWLGGFKKEGESYRTLDGVRERLCDHFELMGDAHDVPFVIRETRRKFQHTISEVTFWRRKGGAHSSATSAVVEG